MACRTIVAMADQDDVRRIALSLPATAEEPDGFRLREVITAAWRCQASKALARSVR